MALLGCLPFSKRWSKVCPEKSRLCKMAVVGDKASGKTSLIYRFSRDRMPSAGIEMTSSFETDDLAVMRDGKTIRVVIHDTSGDEEYAKVRALAYNQVDVVIICLPLDSPETINRLKLDWAPEIHHLCKGKPVLLVGTKKDLRKKSTIYSEQILFISEKQGKEAAKFIGAVGYLECSALDNSDDGDYVKRVFGRAIKECLKRK